MSSKRSKKLDLIKSLISKSSLTDEELINLKIAVNEVKDDKGEYIKSIINTRDLEGKTALHRASSNGDNKFVKFLLEKGAYIDLQDNDGFTALHCAVYNDDPSIKEPSGQFKVITLLLSKGADIDLQTKKGFTPLMIASMKENAKLKNILLKAGADQNIRDEQGRTYSNMYGNIKSIEKHGNKNLEGKRAGLVAYTEDGYLLVVYQNVHRWSFPKGHFDEKLDETLLDTAIREFREETNYKGYIDPSRIVNKMKPSQDTTLFLLEMTPEEVSNIELIDGINVHNDEILNSTWIHINYLDYFRNTYIVNKTISNFNIPQFLLMSGLNPVSFSFKNSRTSKRKSTRKSIKKTRKSTRKSRKSTTKKTRKSKKNRKSRTRV